MLLLIVVIYFLVILLVGWFTSRRTGGSDFFNAGRRAPWWVVAFGMVGATISGISLISVPGMVEGNGWYYLQMCIGFFFGYVAVAYVLLPLYYRMGLTSIYEYLNERFGYNGSRTGSTLFVVAKMVSSATKLYVVILVLQEFIFNDYGIPFWVTTSVCVALIWLYTRRGGMKTIIWTDTLQTLFLGVCIVFILVESSSLIGSIPTVDMPQIGVKDVFNFDDWAAPSHFVKQFFSGVFIVIVMTGLDQDMMQKNLSIASLKKSRRNMLVYGLAFIPVNIALLYIGSLMMSFYGAEGLSVHGDKLLPMFVETELSSIALVCLVMGVISASFASADSALTSITTTISIDLVREKRDGWRRWIHVGVCVVFALVVIAFNMIETKSIIDTIYTIVGYAYGPLLGLFAFGMFTKRHVRAWAIPVSAVGAPCVSYVLNWAGVSWLGYSMGYELLMLNGLITFVMLFAFSRKVIKGTSIFSPR